MIGISLKETVKIMLDINELKKLIESFCNTEVEIKRNDLLHIKHNDITKILLYLKTLDYKTLIMIACSDIIENNIFKLNYIVSNIIDKKQIIITNEIDRNNPNTLSIVNLWKQAEVFEREIHEMFGIHFEGNNRLTEFMLEDWRFDPPLRRDFDTLSFVNEYYEMRIGREDAKDAKEYTKIKKEKKKKEKLAKENE